MKKDVLFGGCQLITAQYTELTNVAERCQLVVEDSAQVLENRSSFWRYGHTVAANLLTRFRFRFGLETRGTRGFLCLVQKWPNP